MGKIYYNGVDYSTPTSSGVAGVKGAAESVYRTGNINITPADIGLGNINNTADKDKSVKYANNAGYANYVNNADDVNGHEIEIGYNNPVTDYTMINFFAAFTSDDDEIIIRPVDDALVREYFSMVTTQEVINGVLTFGNNDDYGLRAYADNYGRIGDSSKQFYEVYANKIYENKTLLSDKYAPKAVELYNSTNTAYNANITLSQNVSNFKTIEIFFVDNDGDDNSIRIRAAAEKFKMNSHAYVSGTWYDKFTYYAVSGTKLNFSSSYQKNQGGVVESGNYHKIYRVVGYKY
ncbi:hypothetical protein [Lachnospira hominis (ex Liu et al. 2021)]|uniref:Uncharacterized protein n=1 Tax=Lachnospira hominis (ex Liu et al. 2021) TaxID=2763051 RepID=A0ABR7G0A3_9FIRM|nr:hypothetical protein [Lachnospira hominis]MBC5680877.1 hypothetical protein [Lachnospira hominis]